VTLRDILAGPVLEAAPALLGRLLVSDIGGERVSVVITEVEAYDGANDPASHAFRGETPRNASMFGPAGTLYVYRSYGIHWCMNVTCGAEGVASAVLLRGGRPVEGVEVMEERRRRSVSLADGPGKLCQALGVTREHDGVDVLGPGSVVRVEGVVEDGLVVEATPRVGISRAVEREWRFVAV
jgi:DNA-3-methyladenine glycosylase